MIWCDLDNTLIWTWSPLVSTPLLSVAFGLPIELHPPRGRGLRRLVRVDVPGLGFGYACVRRNAVAFLRELRQLGRVRMLTSAFRTYAVAMNNEFDLGFATDELTTREEFRRSAAVAVDPKAVLIDNEPEFPTEHAHGAARLQKLRYLGISGRVVVEVPYFRGTTDDLFRRQWRRYVEQVRHRLK